MQSNWTMNIKQNVGYHTRIDHDKFERDKAKIADWRPFSIFFRPAFNFN